MTDKEQNKILANDFLERNFYKSYRSGEKKLEIFLFGQCSANCKYCYIKKHGHDLYPLDISDKNLIIKNTQKILNWYVKNQFRCNIDLFSGDWINTPYAEQIFDMFYNTFKETRYKPKQISIPDNMQFLNNEEKIQLVEFNIERFQKIDIFLSFSASVDGLYCEYDRTPATEEFYIKLRDFLIKHNYRPHPMISSNNIDQWISNYQWWRNNFPDEIVSSLMTLEVRDNTWTNDKIQSLIQYCDFLVDYKFKEYNQDKFLLLKQIFKIPDENFEWAPYDILGFPLYIIKKEDKVPCTNSGQCLAIRAGDLSSAMCHRLFYKELSFGHFNADEDSLIDFEPTNVTLLIVSKKLHRTCLPYCEECKFVGFCAGPCHGASYEDLGNPYVPDKEVCNLYKAKYSFLIYKYYTLGLFDEEGMLFIKNHTDQLQFDYISCLIKNVLNEMGIEFNGIS